MLRSDVMEDRSLRSSLLSSGPEWQFLSRQKICSDYFVDTACRRLGTEVRRESRRAFFLYILILTPFLVYIRGSNDVR